MTRPLVYVTADWGEGGYAGKEQARLFCRQLYEAGYSPICPYLIYGEFLDTKIVEEHADEIEMAAELLRRCRILAVCGNGLNDRMQKDLSIAKKYGIPATSLQGIMSIDGKQKK